MAETVTSLFGGHRPPAGRPPASWRTVQPVACLQSFGYATVTSSAPSSSTGPARRDTDDSLTSYLRRCRHSYRLRNRRSRPFNPDFLGGFPPEPRSVLRNRQGTPRLSGVSSRACEGRNARCRTAALNQAVADIPADRMRMHVCWGSTVAPHHTDVPLMDIIDIVLSAKPMAVSFPAANARHEHEWKIWREVKLPAGKAIVPGVIDSTVNTVEHPEVVADRILNFANVVGRENVIAGVDCGFGTFAGRVQVDTKIVWLKLQSLAEGARLASAQLWAKAA